MTRLSTIQKWAERYAEKLGITIQIKVIPYKECPTSSKIGGGTHCHYKGEHHGTICWNSRAAKNDSRGWRWIIAHEVCHLKVQSHSSPYFDRSMASLGFKEEKMAAQAAGLVRHRHDWGHPRFLDDGQIRKTCLICGATRMGKVLWGTIKKREAR